MLKKIIEENSKKAELPTAPHTPTYPSPEIVHGQGVIGFARALRIALHIVPHSYYQKIMFLFYLLYVKTWPEITE